MKAIKIEVNDDIESRPIDKIVIIFGKDSQVTFDNKKIVISETKKTTHKK
ncbi:MAG: hypothetical protein RSD04_04590 [Clostridia bacterium]